MPISKIFHGDGDGDSMGGLFSTPVGESSVTANYNKLVIPKPKKERLVERKEELLAEGKKPENFLKPKPIPLTKKQKQREALKSIKGALERRDRENSRTIFIGNIPTSTRAKELKALFTPIGEVENARIRSVAYERKWDPEGKHKNPNRKVLAIKGLLNKSRDTCNGYVLFKEESSVEEALKLSGTEFKEHHIIVDRADTDGQVDLGQSVYLAGLPRDVSEEAVWRHFTDKGLDGITKIRIIRDHKTNTGLGFGFVSFDEKRKCRQAVELATGVIGNKTFRIKKARNNALKDGMKPSVWQAKNQKKAELCRENPNAKFHDIWRKSKRGWSAVADVQTTSARPAWMGDAHDAPLVRPKMKKSKFLKMQEKLKQAKQKQKKERERKVEQSKKRGRDDGGGGAADEKPGKRQKYQYDDDHLLQDGGRVKAKKFLLKDKSALFKKHGKRGRVR